MPRVLGSANAHFQPCCPNDEDGDEDEDEDEDEDGDCSIRTPPSRRNSVAGFPPVERNQRSP